MADLNAGDRIVASGLKHPFLNSAACSVALTVSGTAVTDITGATVTFNTVQSTSTVMILGVYDITVSTTGATVIGHCSVDGTDQTAQALLQLTGSTGLRATVGQVWTATLSGSGSHTIKLRGALTVASGSATFNTTTTTITVMTYDF
jgi:hypothetical protein